MKAGWAVRSNRDTFDLCVWATPMCERRVTPSPLRGQSPRLGPFSWHNPVILSIPLLIKSGGYAYVIVQTPDLHSKHINSVLRPRTAEREKFLDDGPWTSYLYKPPARQVQHFGDRSPWVVTI